MKTKADLLQLVPEIAKRLDDNNNDFSYLGSNSNVNYLYDEDGWYIEITFDSEFVHPHSDDLEYTIHEVDAFHLDEEAYYNDLGDEETEFTEEEKEEFLRALEEELIKLYR